MTVTVTPEHVATLRAHLAGDFDEYQQRWATLERSPGKTGYITLISAAFFQAVHRRFKDTSTDADIVEFIGDVRAKFDETGDEVDPQAAEVLIRGALGEDSDTELDDDTVISTQITVLTALVLDENLDDAELGKFLADAQNLANG
jgi:hypothetical protein